MPHPARLLALLAASLLPFLPPAARADATYTFKRGVNISHWVSQNEGGLATYGAPWFGEADVAWIAAQGFDHIRLPVDIRECLDADGNLVDARLEPIRQAIRWTKSRGLGLVLDAHFLPGADFNNGGRDRRAYTDPAVQDKVAAIWGDLARRFAGEGPWLRFEILNEPVATENRQLNPFMHHMLRAIRESNPTRVVYVTSNRWSSFHTVPDVVLPDDPNVALTIHYYEPLIFTHQKAPWVGFKDDLPPVSFPGVVPDVTGHVDPVVFSHHQHPPAGSPLTVQQVKDTFAAVAAWVERTRPGLEVYVGEFGVYNRADPDSTRRWISLVSTEASKRGWGWAVWDYNDSFGVRRRDGSSTPVLEGLFPPAPPSGG